MNKKLKKFKENPCIVFKYILEKLSPLIKDDIFYSKVRYFLIMHERLNLQNPRTYREKIQWIKLFYHNPLYTTLVDKYAVKDYVAERIGEKHIIKTLAVYDSAEEINFNNLPNQFVLKCTHDSGGIIICKNKETLDKKKLYQNLK